MAFQELFTSEEKLSSDDLPWLNEFFTEQGKKIEGKVFSVSAVKETPRGYILFTEYFLCWVWRKGSLGSSLRKTISDALGEETYPPLQVKISAKAKDKFILGFDDSSFASYFRESDSLVEINYPVHPPTPTLEKPLDKEGESRIDPGSENRRRQS